MSERAFRPGDDDAAVLALRAEVWGADHPHTSPDFYRWLFRETPDGPGSGIVSERDGRIVGFAGIGNRSGRIADTPVRISHGLDFMVAPGLGGVLSGRIAIKVLTRHLKQSRLLGFDLSLNFPNRNSHRMLLSRQVRYDPVFETDLYLRAVAPLAFEGATGWRALGASLAGRSAAAYGALRGLKRRRDLEVQRITAFDARFDAHWQALCADGKLRLTRDARTLNWRYRDHPLHDYAIFAVLDADAGRGSAADPVPGVAADGMRGSAGDGVRGSARDRVGGSAAGGVRGFAVVSRRRILGTEACLLCDLCVADASLAIEDALLDRVARQARDWSTPLIVAQARRAAPPPRALLRAGFLRVPARLNPKPFRMLAMGYGAAGDVALVGDNWSFAWGDTDVV